MLSGAVALGLLSTPASGALSPSSPDWSPDQPDIVLAQAAEGKKLHFPNAERLADGSIVAVAREGAGHTGQDGRLLIMSSGDDGGSTWSAPAAVQWRDVGSLDSRVRWGDELTWFRAGGPVEAVRVDVTSSNGWAVLAEVGAREPG